MFELPTSKRVRRADLNRTQSCLSPSPSSSRSSPDPELAIQAAARFAALFGELHLPEPILIPNGNLENGPHGGQGQDGEEEGDEQGFEFRLFSNTLDTPVRRIVLNADQEDDGDGTLVRKERDRSYYFSPPATGEKKAGIESMAVSGETVLQWRNIRARGLEVPWRVKIIRINIPSTLKPNAELADGLADGQEKEGKKCKPNKKRRLILREKLRKKQQIEEERRKTNEGKEEAEREKKTRKNRERKVKRKLKEKAKKSGHATADGTAGSLLDPDVPSKED